VQLDAHLFPDAPAQDFSGEFCVGEPSPVGDESLAKVLA